ncbi:MAG: chalcone isomerase family protein [Burkholderiales bacterium]
MRRTLFAVLMLALFPLPAVAIPPLPAPVAQTAPGLQPVGEGRLRWFGLHIYDAALWASDSNWSIDRAFALDIRYARSISAQRLVSTTLDEMRRLGFTDETTLARWAQALARVFPDVQRGERITGVNRPGEGVLFFHDGRPTGNVGESEFARAFFAIWLDPRTREPKLRESLIGRQ